MAKTTPTPPMGPVRGQAQAGSSRPDTSLAAENYKGLPPPLGDLPQIVTGEELGRLFNLSARSIREYRAKGHVVRAGNGYDFGRSVRGMLDHQRVEAAREYLGPSGEWLLREFEDALLCRRQASDERDRLRAALGAVLTLAPTLVAAIRAADPAAAEATAHQLIRIALGDLIQTTNEPEHEI